jgi:hypothetical protein
MLVKSSSSVVDGWALQVHASVGMTPLGQDKSAAFYQPHDLRLGASVDVHGRRFFLHDCDTFTRQYYQVHPQAWLQHSK